jgi:methionine-rich copper-binding protein CopC
MDEGMTMIYRVKDPGMLKQVKVGDKVQFEGEDADGGFTVTEFGAVERSGVVLSIADPGMIEKNQMSKTCTYAFALTAAILFGHVADAHPQLQSVNPAAGVATGSPKQIRITFSETVIPQFSGVELRDQTGKLIATGKSETDPSNKKILIGPVKEQLAPGNYKVEWHAVSDDTHRVKGSYSFSVAP